MPSVRRVWAVVLAVGACAGPQTETARDPAADLEGLDPPAAVGSFAPRLAVDDGDALLSWLEPLAGGGHRFVVSRFSGDRWTAPAEIARGADFFANWADVPGIGVAGDGTLLAHWLVKTGDETYAYSIALARSEDGGVGWEPMGWLHDDGVPTEHGFVSWVSEGEAARAVWLDGREMPAGGPMTLRTAVVGEVVGPSTVLDDRVCECCPTDLARAAGGALAVYRDRGEDETRNVGRVRIGSGSPPAAVHEDGWRIPGCPVNGPAVDAAGDRVAVAWFTAADEEPRVRAAFSDDGGETFGEPVVVDAGRPLGRVDLRLDADGSAVVTWLEAGDERASLMARRVRRSGTGGASRSAVAAVVAETGASRASGVPRLLRLERGWLVAWVETRDGAPEALRAARLDPSAL